ncbi:MAG: hypothetical protein NT106_06190 [Candidatus Sumerlaeota bacterium]|nr:hypothetical protein [Candidatus Sumerlaeota bacterium]
MESDLIIIDCIEKLRGYLFSLAPSLEKKRESLLSCHLVIEPPERIWEAYVAVFLQIDMDTAAGRRKVHRIIRQIKSEMENPKSTGEIRELPEKEYNQLLSERKARIHNGIKKLGTFMKRVISGGMLKAVVGLVRRGWIRLFPVWEESRRIAF